MSDDPFTGGGETSPSSAPIYYEVSPGVTLALRIYGGVTAFLVFLALIFCFIKGADDSVMYLLAVNMIMSSFIGAVIAWWYHKGIIEANKIAFIVFVGICIIFQAIMSDIYVYRRPTSNDSPINPSPTLLPTNMSSVTLPRHVTAVSGPMPDVRYFDSATNWVEVGFLLLASLIPRLYQWNVNDVIYTVHPIVIKILVWIKSLKTTNIIMVVFLNMPMILSAEKHRRSPH